MKQPTLAMVMALLCFASPVAANAYKCDYMPQEPVPGWIANVPVEEREYIGVGSAEKADTAEGQMEKSLNNALARVVKGVSVTVKSAFKERSSESSRGINKGSSPYRVGEN